MALKGLQFRTETPQLGVGPTTFEELSQEKGFSYLRDKKYGPALKLATLVDRVLQDDLQVEELDDSIAFLSDMLRKRSPVLPLMTGEVPLEDPTKQLPLTFKIVNPSVKMLNEEFGEDFADEFRDRVQVFLEDYFQASAPGTLPILSFLNRDFKTGKAILNLNSPDFAARAPLSAETLLGQFQALANKLPERMTQLFRGFLEERGFAWREDLEVRVFFGAADWSLAESDPLGTEDLVKGVLASERRANMGELRVQSPLDRTAVQRPIPPERNMATIMSPVEEVLYLYKDFKRALQQFKVITDRRIPQIEAARQAQRTGALTEEQKQDLEWASVFAVFSEEGGPEGEAVAPIYYLSVEAIQAFRKGVFEKKFPFVDAADGAALDHLRKVVNQIDVLKPFIQDKKVFYFQRLEKNAALLQANPSTETEKRAHLKTLARELEVSLKNHEEPPVAGTLISLMRETRTALRKGTLGTPVSLHFDDKVALGSLNVLGYFIDLLTLITDDNDLDTDEYDEGRYVDHLLSTGDRFTEVLCVLNVQYKQRYGVMPNTDGGDEREFIGETGPEEEELAFLRANALRRVRSVIEVAPLTDAEIPQLLAANELYRTRVFKALKSQPNFGPSVNCKIEQ